jgi:hypothetical protein
LFDTTGGTDRLAVATSGNVGVGTTNPVALLDLYKASAINGPMLSIRADFTAVGKFAMIRFGDQSQTTNYQKGALIYEGVAGSARGRIHIALENTDTSASVALTDARATFQSDGNVGIGTTLPSGRLHVNSTTAGATLIRADGPNGTLFSVVDDLSDSLMSVNNSAGLPVMEVFADDRVVLGQYGSGDFVLKNNKVGIGQSNPLYTLDVSGTIRFTGITTSSSTNCLVIEPNGEIRRNANATGGTGGTGCTGNTGADELPPPNTLIVIKPPPEIDLVDIDLLRPSERQNSL